MRTVFCESIGAYHYVMLGSCPVGISLKFSKESRQARWRAYAKGCIEMCSKCSVLAMTERANPNNSVMRDVSTKDIKQLEILKPRTIPSMGQRHKLSLEKEMRLVAASRPIKKASSSIEKAVKEEEVSDEKLVKRNGTRKKKRSGLTTGNTQHEQSSRIGLNQEDTVEELNWSDDDNE